MLLAELLAEIKDKQLAGISQQFRQSFKWILKIKAVLKVTNLTISFV